MTSFNQISLKLVLFQVKFESTKFVLFQIYLFLKSSDSLFFLLDLNMSYSQLSFKRSKRRNELFRFESMSFTFSLSVLKSLIDLFDLVFVSPQSIFILLDCRIFTFEFVLEVRNSFLELYLS